MKLKVVTEAMLKSKIKDVNDIFKYEQINNEGKILKISVFHI